MRESPDIWMEGARQELWRAGVLRRADDAAGAYFHGGQAVEFALKAILLRRHNLVEMPEQYRGAIQTLASLRNELVAGAGVEQQRALPRPKVSG